MRIQSINISGKSANIANVRHTRAAISKMFFGDMHFDCKSSCSSVRALFIHRNITSTKRKVGMYGTKPPQCPSNPLILINPSVCSYDKKLSPISIFCNSVLFRRRHPDPRTMPAQRPTFSRHLTELQHLFSMNDATSGIIALLSFPVILRS